jgi:hypothetical protein
MNTDKIAHLGFIQGVISRMGNNSFLLKGWSVALVAALFALSAKDANKLFIVIAFFPVLIFWVLDAFFLHQEHLYRKLYEEVADGKVPSTKFTLNPKDLTEKRKVRSMISLMFSKTLLPFHLILIFLIILAMIFLNTSQAAVTQAVGKL